MSNVVKAAQVAESLTQYWSPRIIGEVDNNYIKVAKLLGNFTWHTHENEDEMFLILKGHLTIELKDQTIELDEGDMYVVPKGVAHNPIAQQECHVMLFEQKNTAHTGEVMTDKTRSLQQQLAQS